MSRWVTYLLAVAILCSAGCACSGYRVELAPETDMNRQQGAVRVDLVWMTPADAHRLQNTTSLAWFKGVDGNDPLAQSREFQHRTITARVGLKDAGGPLMVLGDGDLVPPENLDVVGFVVFARYSKMPELAQDGLHDYYDAKAKKTRTTNLKTCHFIVRLESNQLTLEPQPRTGIQGLLP